MDTSNINAVYVDGKNLAVVVGFGWIYFDIYYIYTSCACQKEASHREMKMLQIAINGRGGPDLALFNGRRVRTVL